jgi:hypothetical protein
MSASKGNCHESKLTEEEIPKLRCFVPPGGVGGQPQGCLANGGISPWLACCCNLADLFCPLHNSVFGLAVNTTYYGFFTFLLKYSDRSGTLSEINFPLPIGELAAS